MELYPFFRSVIELDKEAVVLVGISHQILYMNPAAVRQYKKRGGERLIGRSLLDCHNENSQKIILETLAWMEQDPSHNKKFIYRRNGKDTYIVALRDETGKLIGYYEKYERR